jgi:Skp family chaperone for outer membrane proteins
MDIKEQILVALGLNKPVKLAWQAKSEDGTIFVSTAESLEAGVDVSVLTEDGTTILLPIGTYTTDTGVTFRVETEGVVAEVIESETEEEVTVEEEELADVGDWEGMEKRIQNLEDAVADLKRDKVGGDDSVEMADEEATEEVVTEVVEKVEEAVEEIAAAIDDATPEEVTPELAAKAAEVAIEIMQDKAEDVAEDSEGDTDMGKKKEEEYSKFSKMEKELKELREKLNDTPGDKPVNTNKFSSNKRFATLSKKEYGRLSRKDKFLYDLYK